MVTSVASCVFTCPAGCVSISADIYVRASGADCLSASLFLAASPSLVLVLGSGSGCVSLVYPEYSLLLANF